MFDTDCLMDILALLFQKEKEADSPFGKSVFPCLVVKDDLLVLDILFVLWVTGDV